MLRDHKWKQNILELKSQWLEDQEASGPAPRDPWDNLASFLYGTICSCSTCFSSWGMLKVPGQLAVSLGLRVKTAGPEADPHPSGQGCVPIPLCSSPALSGEHSVFPTASLVPSSVSGI